MEAYQTPPGGWNLFASILQEILAAHGLGLGHLDDRANIHREKVRRLQLSLKVHKSFPVLNIDEMERVVTAFQLNRKEKTRLRAAILATSIEETLMDRINPDDALKAAEQILDIIEQALREHAHDLADRVGLANVGQELVAEPLPLGRAAHQAGDIHEPGSGRHDAGGAEHLGQHRQPHIGDADDAHVGVDRRERVVGRQRAGLGQRVEKGGLADVGKADNADGQAHPGSLGRGVGVAARRGGAVGIQVAAHRFQPSRTTMQSPASVGCWSSGSA